MPYSIQIDRIGADGTPVESILRESSKTEEAALAVVRHAMASAKNVRQPRTYTVYGPTGELVFSYTSGDNRTEQDRLRAPAP